VTRLPGAWEPGVPVALRVTAVPGLPSLTSARPPRHSAPPLLASPSRPVNAEHPAYGVIPGSWGCPEFPLKPDHPR